MYEYVNCLYRISQSGIILVLAVGRSPFQPQLLSPLRCFHASRSRKEAGGRTDGLEEREREREREGDAVEGRASEECASDREMFSFPLCHSLAPSLSISLALWDPHAPAGGRLNEPVLSLSPSLSFPFSLSPAMRGGASIQPALVVVLLVSPKLNCSPGWIANSKEKTCHLQRINTHILQTKLTNLLKEDKCYP